MATPTTPKCPECGLPTIWAATFYRVYRISPQGETSGPVEPNRIPHDPLSRLYFCRQCEVVVDVEGKKNTPESRSPTAAIKAAPVKKKPPKHKRAAAKKRWGKRS
jgi:hypothetical protein